MKYTTFRNMVAVLGIAAVIGGGALAIKSFGGSDNPPPTHITPVAYVPPPVVQQNPLPPPSPVATNAVRATTEEVRTALEIWLTAYGDRQGQMQRRDVLPNATFKATAIRFKEADAVKWSDNSSQWSQIRLDLDRDGVDDEKWLLKNGHTYKREMLDGNGRTTSTQYFDK